MFVRSDAEAVKPWLNSGPTGWNEYPARSA